MVAIADEFADLWTRATPGDKKLIKLMIEKDGDGNGNRKLWKKQAIELLAFLARKTGKAFRPVDVNIEPIIGRLKSGATIEQCRAVIANRVAAWGDEEKSREWLRPKTIFNKTNFENYLGEVGGADESGT